MNKIPRVGLWIDAGRAYERGLIRGVLRYARLHGPWTLLRNMPVQSGGPAQPALDEARRWKADGFLWRETHPGERVKTLRCPIVYSPCTQSLPGIPNILTDENEIGSMAAEHLLGLGLRHFAYYGLSDAFCFSAGRRRAFSRRLQIEGYTVSHFNALEADGPASSREQRLRAWLSELPRPFGMMLCTDDCCVACFEACQAMGLKIPGDAYVIGVGNDEITCDFVQPSLTSISLGTESAGYEAARRLAVLMDTTQHSKRLDPVPVRPLRVVQRRSTDQLAIEDPLIARAVAFIRDHATRNLHVRDVLQAVPLSRRNLYRRFERHIGHPIYEEIRRARIDRAAQLLLETNLPVEQIAQHLGYDDAKNFARLFAREKQVTPRQFRRMKAEG